jgi:gamma-glutamyl:cysteine ligase YbdK (ATP-grasp superfamily)
MTKSQDFAYEDFYDYRERLVIQLRNMNDDLNNGIFNSTSNMIGQEIELVLLDKNYKPALGKNEEVIKILEKAKLYHTDLEFGSWNVETHTKPKALESGALFAEEAELLNNLKEIRKAADKLDLKVGTAGILETLTDKCFTRKNSRTDKPRYRMLVEQTMAFRNNEPLSIDISNNRNKFKTKIKSCFYEASTTSNQQHLQLKHTENQPRYMNASLILAAPLLSVCANSPFVFGRGPLWKESRIPLFEQSVDTRNKVRRLQNLPTRCGFGIFYYKDARDFFNIIVNFYSPMFPGTLEGDKIDEIEREKRNNTLLDLKLLAGTVWWWVRPVIEYNPLNIRIENRSMPAGPTVIDMMANSTLYWGAVYAMVQKKHPMLNEVLFPFFKAKENFYCAAQKGNCRMAWLTNDAKQINKNAFTILEEEILPLAEEGLDLFEIPSGEREKYLGVIRGRLKKGMSPADWKIDRFEELTTSMSREAALKQIVKECVEKSEKNEPLVG